MKKLMFNCRFALKHILRSPLRTLLLAGFALFNVLALAYLLHTIAVGEERLDHLFLTTYVHGAVVSAETFVTNAKASAPITSDWTVERLVETGFVSDLYLEKIAPSPVLFAAMPERGFDADMPPACCCRNRSMLVINDFSRFVNLNQPRLLEAAVAGAPPYGGELVITFAEGLYEGNFAYISLEHYQQPVIPILAHVVLLERLGLYIGGYAYAFDNTDNRVFPVRIIGSFMGGHPASLGRFLNPPYIIMHHEAYHQLMPTAGYAVIQFTIDPARNRELEYFEAAMDRYLRGARARAVFGIPLGLFMDDSELRDVVIPLEQNLNLLRQLLPIAIVLACVLTGGLSLLLMMQRAHFAAIMRVLGTTKVRTRVFMAAEQIFVCVAGVGLGLLAAFLLEIGLEASLIMPIAVSFAGGVVGSAAGAFIISSRPPLDLLQVRE